MPFEGYGATVRAHLETAELLKLLDAGSNIGLGGAHDVRPAAESAQLGGLLTGPQLLDIRDTLDSARSLYRAVERAESVAPTLWDRTQTLPDTLHLEIGRAHV